MILNEFFIRCNCRSYAAHDHGGNIYEISFDGFMGIEVGTDFNCEDMKFILFNF